MKTMGFMLSLLVSFAALSTSYSGEGEWKSGCGESGSYTAVVDVKPENDENAVVIEQTLTFSDDEVLNFSVTLEKIDDTFYNVLDEDGEQVGTGYCWPLENDEKICHSTTFHDDYLIEVTVKKTADAIYRVGSKTNTETNETTTWKDKLVAQ